MRQKRNSLSQNLSFLKRLPRLDLPLTNGAFGRSRLTETTDFGSDPGNLRMLSFMPEKRSKPSPLVVVLHGCTQTASGYDIGAGWSKLAERYGFALLMPEQRPANNPNGCFNWFNVADATRDSGEAHSIQNMIAQMSLEHDIDENRVFVTGLSAGGAMTSVMLATYPQVFAGGAIIAGLPYGVAHNVQSALSAMHQPSQLSSRELGHFVRSASDHRGSWPTISVWHGTADRTVSAINAEQIVKQWISVHDLDADVIQEDVIDGYPRQAWVNESGESVIESFSITNMPHGTPLGVGEDDEHFGTEGAYLFECGISSSFHIAKFFGLIDKVYEPRSQVKSNSVSENSLAKKSTLRSPIAIGDVIARALAAAGLVK